jgi:Ras family
LMTYTMAGFVEHYVPTIFDNFSVIEEFDGGKLVNITLWDTAGQDDYALFRTKTCYKNTDIFLVCFSVVSPHSFQNVKQKVCFVAALVCVSPGVYEVRLSAHILSGSLVLCVKTTLFTFSFSRLCCPPSYFFLLLCLLFLFVLSWLYVLFFCFFLLNIFLRLCVLLQFPHLCHSPHTLSLTLCLFVCLSTTVGP